MKTKTVKPYGMLYSQGREYFLLHPYPVPKDSWQGDNAYMFLVTPRKAVDSIKNAPEHLTLLPESVWEDVYPIARHIVTNAFVAEYVDGMPEITILEEE